MFVDTNVLVYASWSAAPLHAHTRSGLAAQRSAGAQLVISRQIIRAWLATLNRPRSGLALADLIAEAHAFSIHFSVLDDTAAVTERLLPLLPQASGVRVHDVTIMAPMQVAGVRRLRTNDAGDFAACRSMINIISL